MAFISTVIREVRLPYVHRFINTMFTSDIIAARSDRETVLSTRNARRLKVEHDVANKPKDCLHWAFHPATSRSLLPMACMRNYYKRRWNNAFVQALKHNGFDTHGRRIRQPVSRWGDSSWQDSPEPGLVGTLEIRLFNAIFWDEKDQAMMLQHSDNIVKGLVKLQANSKYKPLYSPAYAA